MEENMRPISKAALGRITQYLNYLESLPEDGPSNISSTAIAEEMGLNQVQVRKDLACVGNGGKPKIGYVRVDLIADIEHFLGHDNATEAIIVGAGNLGKALMAYGNFIKYGLSIIAAFDRRPELIGTEIAGKRVYDIAELEAQCRQMGVKVGIITVPAPEAQTICDHLVEGGVRAIWNFAPANLTAPKRVVVKNENMSASIAVLLKMLSESLYQFGAE